MTTHNPDLTDAPLPTDPDPEPNRVPPALTGNTRDDDGQVIDAYFEPNPNALPYEGLASETADYARENTPAIGRLLSSRVVIGHDGTDFRSPALLMPRDPKRAQLRIQFVGRVVIGSDHNDCYNNAAAGAPIASVAPNVVQLDGYTGAVWVYGPSQADGLIEVVGIAGTQ